MPYVDVSHLASSSSYYSSILQPLGLHYIGTVPGENGSAEAVIFGAEGQPVLQIRQRPSLPEPLKLSAVVFAASTASAVAGFHTCASLANPALPTDAVARDWDQRYPHRTPSVGARASSPWLGTDSGICLAVAHDLDGNRMEAVYPNVNPSREPIAYTGSSVRRTQSTRDEVTRILDWNYDVASARPVSSSPMRTGADAMLPQRFSMSRRPGEQPLALRRSLTHDATSSFRSPAAQPSSSQPVTDASPRRDSLSGGLSTSAVVGAILGAAAGAAVTYTLVSRERNRAPRHDRATAPYLPRRATFPDRPVTERISQYGDQSTIVNKYASRKSVPQDTFDQHDGSWSLARTKYPPNASRSTARTNPASREADDAYDTRSRASSRLSNGRSRRARSETPLGRSPIGVAGGEYPNYEHTDAAPGSLASRLRHNKASAGSQLDRSAYESERESYVSARSHRTSDTVRPRGPAASGASAEYDLAHRSMAGSKGSVRRRTTSKPPSRVSARHVPLPASGVGSSQANWDDDLNSVAPSDSISCVGSKIQRRSQVRY